MNESPEMMPAAETMEAHAGWKEKKEAAMLSVADAYRRGAAGINERVMEKFA